MVVPPINKWFTHLVVAGAIIETLDSLGLSFPEVTAEQRQDAGRSRKKFSENSRCDFLV